MKILTGFMMAFAILTVVFGLLELGFVGATEVATFEVLFNPFSSDPVTWAGSLWDVVTFDYIFFDGGWELVRYIFCYPISAGFAVWLVITLAQALGSAIGGLMRLVGR